MAELWKPVRGREMKSRTWSSEDIQRRLLNAIAVAMQRGNALTMLTAYSRATSIRAEQRGPTSGSEEREPVCDGLEVRREA